MSTVSCSTTTTTAYKVAADTTGTLVLQTGTTPTTAMTIDASQNVGVGVTPSAWYSTYKALQIASQGVISADTVSNGALEISNNSYRNSAATPTYINSFAATLYTQYRGEHRWYNAASGTAGNAITFTQAMTLDASGNFLLGVTTAGSGGLSGFSFNSPTGPSNVWIGHTTGTASGTAYVGFNYNGSGIGSITQNGTTGVLYNLTSDYRLKNNQEDLTGAKDFIMALKPKKWQWWDGSGEGVGFIAHEFMEVAKYSGHGEKDAVETIEIKDEDGNVTGTKERPVYQSIQPSSSEVMANLVSLIQEQQAIIQAQAADIAALKAKVGI
jgi:Chaperone of endosialidase